MPRANRRHTPVQSPAGVPSAPSVSIHDRRAPTLEASERALLQSVERGEWATVARFPEMKVRYTRDAKATLRRPRRV